MATELRPRRHRLEFFNDTATKARAPKIGMHPSASDGSFKWSDSIVISNIVATILFKGSPSPADTICNIYCVALKTPDAGSVSEANHKTRLCIGGTAERIVKIRRLMDTIMAHGPGVTPMQVMQTIFRAGAAPPVQLGPVQQSPAPSVSPVTLPQCTPPLAPPGNRPKYVVNLPHDTAPSAPKPQPPPVAEARPALEFVLPPQLLHPPPLPKFPWPLSVAVVVDFYELQDGIKCLAPFGNTTPLNSAIVSLERLRRFMAKLLERIDETQVKMHVLGGLAKRHIDECDSVGASHYGVLDDMVVGAVERDLAASSRCAPIPTGAALVQAPVLLLVCPTRPEWAEGYRQLVATVKEAVPNVEVAVWHWAGTKLPDLVMDRLPLVPEWPLNVHIEQFGFAKGRPDWARLTHYQQAWEHACGLSQPRVFIDVSNVVMGAQQDPVTGRVNRMVRVNLGRLVDLVEGTPFTARRVAVGSFPPRASPFWQVLERKKYEVTVMEQTDNGRELGIDDQLHLRIFSSLSEGRGQSGHLVLLTGDGNAHRGDSSFYRACLDALRQGWRVTLWAWRRSCSKAYVDLHNQNPLFVLRYFDHYRDWLIYSSATESPALASAIGGTASLKPVSLTPPHSAPGHSIGQGSARQWQSARDGPKCLMCSRPAVFNATPCGHPYLCLVHRQSSGDALVGRAARCGACRVAVEGLEMHTSPPDAKCAICHGVPCVMSTTCCHVVLCREDVELFMPTKDGEETFCPECKVPTTFYVDPK